MQPQATKTPTLDDLQQSKGLLLHRTLSLCQIAARGEPSIDVEGVFEQMFVNLLDIIDIEGQIDLMTGVAQ